MPTQRKPRPDGKLYCSEQGCKNTFAPRFKGQRYGRCTSCVQLVAQLNEARRLRRQRHEITGDAAAEERLLRMTCKVHLENY